MNKSVLFSIRPIECERIANGRQSILLTKRKPKLEPPFKGYIYETKGLCDTPTFIDEDGHWSYRGRGKVIGEFICDRIDEIACHKYHNGVGFDYSYYTDTSDRLIDETQLSDYDMQRYLGCAEDGEIVGYALHITDLKIYDTPKELGEFRRATMRCYGDEKSCHQCARVGTKIPGYKCEISLCLTRAPQSWCYVEEI